MSLCFLHPKMSGKQHPVGHMDRIGSINDLYTSQLEPFDIHLFQVLGWHGNRAQKPVDKSFGRGDKWDKDGFKHQRCIARGIDFVRKNETETWLQYWSLVVLQDCERPNRVTNTMPNGWLKFWSHTCDEFQCSTHSCSSIILSQFLSGHCDPYLIWLVSRHWSSQATEMTSFGLGGVPGVFGGRCPMVVCHIHPPQEAGKDTFIHQQESCWVKTQLPSPNPKPCQRIWVPGRLQELKGLKT